MDDTENTVNRNLRAMLGSEGGDQAVEIARSLEDLALSRWFKPALRTDPNRGPDMQILQVAATYRLVAMQQETADLHQIVRQLNERLAKLERG